MQIEKEFLDLNADELNDLYLEQYELLRSSDPEIVRNAQFMMDQIRWATDRFYSRKKTFREREPGMYKDMMNKKKSIDWEMLGWRFVFCVMLLLLIVQCFRLMTM